MYSLVIFDLDGTLAERDSKALYLDARTWLDENKDTKVFIATNQGGVGLRAWMEAEKFGTPNVYPTQDMFIERCAHLFAATDPKPEVLVCYAYQSKSSGKWGPAPFGVAGSNEWNPDWRKPSPGMVLYAMKVAEVQPSETLMVGDSAEDEECARRAGITFQWAWQFFGRPAPTQDSQS